MQEVVLYELGNGSYSIQCSFLSGSDAHGCVYVLIGGEGVRNVTGIIERESAEGVTLENLFGCYTELQAYDWEADNTTGTTPIRIPIEYSAEMCTVPTSEPRKYTIQYTLFSIL